MHHHHVQLFNCSRTDLIYLVLCLQRAGKPSWYITCTKVNSAFHPFGVGKLSTGLSGWG